MATQNTNGRDGGLQFSSDSLQLQLMLLPPSFIFPPSVVPSLMTLCRGILGKLYCFALLCLTFRLLHQGINPTHGYINGCLKKKSSSPPTYPAYYSYQYENHRYLTKGPCVVASSLEASVRVAKSQDNSVLRGFSSGRPCIRLRVTAHH